MAVQAQYPSNVILPDYCHRGRPTFVTNNRNFFSPTSFTKNFFSDEDQIQPKPLPIVGVYNPLRMFNQSSTGANLSHVGQAPPLMVLYDKAENEVGCNLLCSRKRAREDDDLLRSARQQQRQLLSIEYHQIHGSAPITLQTSAGLRLAFQNDRQNSTCSTSTSGKDVTSSLLAAMGEDLNTQLQQQRIEVEQFFKLQSEQARQQLEEKRQRHSRALRGAIEEAVLLRLRAKDLEIEKFKLQNQELMKHAEHLRIEGHHWQTKAKAMGALVSTLRTSLQQAQAAVSYSLEQGREGCGDSEADDAASSHYGDLEDVHARTLKENRELREQRTCRVCRCNDVSILLLPCRHLCLCKECETRLDACPICQALKNASVQVYMSSDDR